MNKSFTNALRAIAVVLGKFADNSIPGTLKWDGKTYTSVDTGPNDVLAAKWWGMVTALAGILETQITPLTVEQKNYLDRLLFGGMGSLNDFMLDEQRLGPKAVHANQELNRLRQELFDIFQLI